MTVCTSRVVARSLLWTALIVLPAVAGACRDSGGNEDPDASMRDAAPYDANPLDPDAAPPPDADPSVPDANLTLPDGMPTQPSNPADVTVYEVQGDLAEDVVISLKGVVVTAIDAFEERGGSVGSFWIQEPAGGAYSGVQVFTNDLTQVGALAVGDIVDVAGVVKDEFALTGFESPLTELKVPTGGEFTVVKTSAPPVTPVPVTLDALAIAQLGPRERNFELEKWEGVLVRVVNTDVVSSPRVVSNQPNFREFRVRGILVDSSIGALPTNDELAIGRCLGSVTGIMSFFFNYKVLPRPNDVVLTGGTCAPVAEERVEAACGNQIDEDGDGFADCNDASCWIDTRACAGLQQIPTIQAGTLSMDAKVALHDVFITGLTPDRKSLWVSTSATAAASNGLFVFRTNAAALTDEFVVGAKVHVAGRVKEFDVNPAAGDTLTQLDLGTASFVAAPGDALAPVTTATPATLSSIADGEVFESVLVKVDHLRILSTAAGDKVRLANDAGQEIVMDDNAFNYAVTIPDPANPGQTLPNPDFAVGTCFTSVTGIMSVELTDNVRTLNPTSAAALVRGKGCVVPPTP